MMTNSTKGDLRRGLTKEAWNGLRSLAQASGGNWWKDLLRLWKAAGQDGATADAPVLRLAVRHNYLNFYHRGQSVARVDFGSRHGDGQTPWFETHVKYVDPRQGGQDYLTFDGAHGILTNGAKHRIAIHRYPGEASLLAWVANTREHTGHEKRGVEALVAVNSHVIDLEMGQPAHDPKRNVAPRMDLVALEEDGSQQARLVFWEAKTLVNDSLRSTTVPKVLAQLSTYERYISDRHESIKRGYAEVCHCLVELHKMALEVGGNPGPLDQLITDVAANKRILQADFKPRLVVFGRLGKKMNRTRSSRQSISTSSGTISATRIRNLIRARSGF